MCLYDIEKYCDTVPFVSYFQCSRGTYLLHEAFYLVSNCFFLSLENFGSDEAAWWLVPWKNFSTYMIISSLCYWHLDVNRLDISGFCLADIWPHIEDSSTFILELLPNVCSFSLLFDLCELSFFYFVCDVNS